MAISTTDVLIAGAGPVGATIAALLAKNSINVVVLDTKKHTANTASADPRGLALTHASRHILSNIDIWEDISATQMGKIKEIQVWDENGEGMISFKASEIGHSELAYILEQSFLEQRLTNSLSELSSVKLFSGIRIAHINWDRDRISVTTEDGSGFQAKLLIAADGSHSICRELAGTLYTEQAYDQHALACTVRTELSHNNIARQRFLTDGPLAFLPMSDPNTCNIVWSTTPDRARELSDMELNDFKSILENAFDSTLGKIDDVFMRRTFPLKKAYAIQYCRDRFVLVGDAAHSIHPLAGQGANLGFLDAASLAEVLVDAVAQHRDIGAKNVLRRYERWRKGDNHQAMLTMDGFKYLFENQSSPWPIMRNTGMDMVNSMIPVKHFIMRRAMGLEGDLPVIARPLVHE